MRREGRGERGVKEWRLRGEVTKVEVRRGGVRRVKEI
jgi:hypothetical protein